MNNITEVLNQKADCTGCRACFNVCPAKAITMKEDEEGFFYPQVDNSVCTNCGMCKKACPALNKSEVYRENTLNPDCYALMADDETRLVSSSGGAFSIFANYILENNGYVCGAAFVGQKVQHIIINKKEDLYKLRGSKYVQSDTNTVFSQIKELLKNGEKVLFTGTPCQTAGLNTYLGKKYENLYTIDLICHGVPPQKVFDMYINEVTEGDFINTNFRDKISGWDVYTTTTTTTGVYSYTKKQDLFLNAFLNNMCLRPSCGSCKFTTTRREADITIGDFWAIDRYDKKLNDRMGTSLVLLNNSKSKKLLNLIEKKCKIFTKVPLEYATFYNWTLYRTLPQHPNRNAFFRILKSCNSLGKAVEYCVKNKYDCALLGVWPYNNYGSSLTMYALQEAIKELGYIPKCINYHKIDRKHFDESLGGQFSNKYLDLTSYYGKYNELKSLNNETQTFIVGSDCMWHPPFYSKISKEYPHFLSFASPDAKKIAFSTSFGTYDYQYKSDEKYRMQYYLQQFDRISIREKAGIDLCSKIFNLKVDQTWDPVFLLERSKYDKIINESKLDIHYKYIAGYNFWPNLKIKKFINEIQEKINLPILNIKDAKYNVADFLYLIKNSELLITHSFHGMCFALIFNIPFIVWKITGFDDNRYTSVLKTLNLENRLVVDIETINNRPDLFEPIDWDKVNSILEKEKTRSLKWLKDALDAPKDMSKIKPEDAMIQYLNTKIIDLQTSNISREGFLNVLDYNKNYRKYLKYKILKNVVFGKTRNRYKQKQKLYHEKIRSARRVKRGISNV